MIKNRKEITYTLIVAISVILSLSLTTAFGVTPIYWKDRPLIMSPGETKVVQIILQNMVGERDVTLKAELIQGKEIAELIDKKEYLIPLGKDDIKANLKISISKNTKNNDKYTVSISFTEIPGDKGKMLQIAGSAIATFPIIIEEREAKKQSSALLISVITFITLTTLIILLITSILMIKRKEKSF